MGPTASGKTHLALELIQYLPVEIISVDSAQIYRTMDIGTAKPSPEILRRTPHQLIDIRDPSQSYSAGAFRQDTISAIKTILAKQHIPLLVGGTMLYFHILQQGIATLPKANTEIRAQLQHELKHLGLNKLYHRLQVIDPAAAQRIHPHDPQRLLRALEIYQTTGKTLTELQNTQSPSLLPYSFINIAIIPPDKNAHGQLIEKRLQNMLKQGFLEEVQKLFNRGDLHRDLPSMRTVGYRQLWEYLEAKHTYRTMQERTIIATRQLAKRQKTWLRSWKNLSVFPNIGPATQQKSLALIKPFL
jgi:tRNA dimethylallyltransferase